jgi:hypothetical protein
VKGHGDDVGVALGPVGHVAKTSDPLLGVELDIAEPGVAIWNGWSMKPFVICEVFLRGLPLELQHH